MHTRKRSARRVGAAVAAVGLVAAACGSSKKDNSATGSSASSKSKAVSLAFVGALTGDNANLGINIRNGAKLAVDQANKNGANITLKEFDTQGSPDQAATLKDKFINDSSIIGVVGPAFSGETKAVLPDLQSAGLVMISASATNASLPTVVQNETVFHRVIPDDDVQGQGIASYITKKLQVKKMAFVDDNSDYGKGLAGGTQDVLTKAGVTATVTDHIDPKSQDFSATVNKVKAANVDALFYGGYYAEAGRLKKQLSDAGVKATFISGDGSLDPGFIAASGAAGGEGAQLTCPCNLATTDAPGALGQFAKDYKAAFNKDAGTYSTEGFDSANILIKAINAGNTDRKSLLDFVNTKLGTYQGVSKQIAFASNGNVKATGVFIFEIKSGKITLIGDTSSLTGSSSSTSSSTP
jgi:branched-chain amino acid transport system substrate-binding protein